MISARKAKQLDATTMFTYSHANTPLGQSERAYYLSYFINGTFPCRRPRCKTCAHTNPASQINTPGGPLTIRQRFSCTTSNLVYIITCWACTLSYVGETGHRLGDRFCEHLRSVSKKADLPVAKHFSSPGHTADEMMVAVVRAGLHNTSDRRRAEGRLIFECKTLQPRGINIDFNFI